MKKKNIILGIVLLFIIIILSGVIFYIYHKYETLEEKYEELYDKDDDYDFDEDINKPLDQNNTTNNYLSRTEVLKIALKDLKINEKDIYDLDIELENKPRYNTVVYEVSFDYDYLEYEYYIDAKTGKILDSFKSRD